MVKIYKRGNREVAVMEVHPDLVAILDKIIQNVTTYTKQATKISYYSASKIAAGKYVEAGLYK